MQIAEHSASGLCQELHARATTNSRINLMCCHIIFKPPAFCEDLPYSASDWLFLAWNRQVMDSSLWINSINSPKRHCSSRLDYKTFERNTIVPEPLFAFPAHFPNWYFRANSHFTSSSEIMNVALLGLEKLQRLLTDKP